MNKLIEKLKALFAEVDGVNWEEIESEANGIVTTFSEEKERLLNKNRDLLGDLKTFKEKVKNLENEASKIDLVEYNRLKEEEEERLLNGDPSGKAKIDIENIKAQLERKHMRELAKKDEEIKALSESQDKLNSNINSMLIEKSINDQLASGYPIRDEFKPMLTSFFRNQAFVESESGERVVYMKDKSGTDIPASDFFDFWKTSDEAKIYLKAEDSTGGGSSGSKGKFTKPKKWSEMTPSDRVNLYRENPAEYERLKNGGK